MSHTSLQKSLSLSQSESCQLKYILIHNGMILLAIVLQYQAAKRPCQWKNLEAIFIFLSFIMRKQGSGQEGQLHRI